MKDASGNIIKTRATGSFFHSAANSSFTLDTTSDSTYEFEF